MDVYTPHNHVNGDIKNKEHNTLYYYDNNSLYPSVMATIPMPCGKPVAFVGDIRSVQPDAYGFFYCTITSPANMENPILQKHVHKDGETRTVAGLGTWNGWVTTIEMDNAIKYGYTFTIHKGYKFKPVIIFKEYVEKMYELRQQYPKGHPLNLIAKLLMNSLYGKFGTKTDRTVLEIFSDQIQEDIIRLRELLEFIGETFQDVVRIDETHYLTVRKDLTNFGSEDPYDTFLGPAANVGVSSMVASGGRAKMSPTKTGQYGKCYYTDTDSSILDTPLPDHMIGKGLGQFKLEYVIKKAVFLAPKVLF